MCLCAYACACARACTCAYAIDVLMIVDSKFLTTEALIRISCACVRVLRCACLCASARVFVHRCTSLGVCVCDFVLRIVDSNFLTIVQNQPTRRTLAEYAQILDNGAYKVIRTLFLVC